MQDPVHIVFIAPIGNSVFFREKFFLLTAYLKSLIFDLVKVKLVAISYASDGRLKQNFVGVGIRVRGQGRGHIFTRRPVPDKDIFYKLLQLHIFC